jgi:methyl-accepting chemotaxis protein
VGTTRAAERVTLACRALSAAAEDLRLEHVRHKLEAIDDAANRLAAETERICELAEELVTLARALEPVGSQ